MIGKTNSQTGGSVKGEKLNISLKTNQTGHDDLLGAIITVTHPGGTTQYPWEGYEITVNIPPYVEYSVEYSDVEGYATPASFSSTAIEDNSRTLTAEYKTTVITASIGSNQTDKTDVADATITIGGKALKNGQSAKFATGSSLTATFSAVTGYATPASQNITASGTAMTVSGTYNSTFVTVVMADNQSSLNDIASATAKVSASGITTQTVSNGGVVKVPTGVSCTVTWNALTDYKTPAAQTFTTSGTSVTKTGTYQTELVSVTLSADDGSSVNGATVKINGKSQTWNGTALTQKVAFGTTYTVEAGDLEGLVTPDSQTYTAAQSSRNLVFVYKASAIKVNILSNQTNDSVIAGVKAKVYKGYYGPIPDGTGEGYVWDEEPVAELRNGESYNTETPAAFAWLIEFPDVEGYKVPVPVMLPEYTWHEGIHEVIGTYQCELLTVNVSSDNGSVSGYEVTIAKQETVGVATKYTKLEYIESNGTQYIDTEFKPNNNTRVVMDAQYVSSPTTLNALFGARTSATSKNYAFLHTNQGVMRSDYNNVYSQTWVSVRVERFVVDKNKETTTLHNESQSYTNSTFQCDYNMYLCALNNAGSLSWYSSIRLYSCQIYDNGTLVRDYVPALRSDGIAGLYDFVNDTFYASNGSSNFTAGTKSEEVIVTQTSVTGSYKIPFDASYTVQASKVSGYDTPASVTRIASAKSYTVTQEYKVITAKDLSLYDVYGNSINQSTANCYVVREAGQYKFPLVFGNAIKNGKVNTAAFTNNGSTYSHDFVDVDGNVISTPYMEFNSENYSRLRVSIENKDTEGVVSNATLISGTPCSYVLFDVSQVPSEGANVIISANVNDGDYCGWSWHIWLWPHDLSPVEITNSTGVKYNIMPVNLASKYDSDGVHIKNWFYQWGRMTPMLCPASYNSSSNHSPGTITAASRADTIISGMQSPTTFYFNTSFPNNWFGDTSYYNLWDAACTGTGSSDNDSVKTVYDPCPVGWKVPNGNTFSGLSIIGNANGIVKMARYSGDTVGVGFPFSGFRSYSDGSFNFVGSRGFVWLSSANSQRDAYRLTFLSDSVYPRDGDRRSYGFSVRPVQDDNIQLEVIMISFYIPGYNLQAESGMTWFEWIHSEYNTVGLSIQGTAITKDGGNTYFYNLSTGTFIKPTENIIGGAQYYAKSPTE